MFTPTTHHPMAGSFASVDITPAISLTRDLPQGMSAYILCLVGPDLAHHLLFTLGSEKGLPLRKRIDVTACAEGEQGVHQIARNILIFTLIIDSKTTSEQAWSIYYDAWLANSDLTALQSQAKKLAELSSSLETWYSSPYSQLRFCDPKTLELVREVWTSYTTSPEAGDSFHTVLERSQQRKEEVYGQEGQAVVTSSARSCAPLSVGGLVEALAELTEENWQNAVKKEEKKKPNPVFVSALACNDVNQKRVLEYPTDPLIGFHLASSNAPLTPLSPLRIENADRKDIKERILETAKMQWASWVEAFREAVGKKRVTVRFAAADFFSFCWTLKRNKDHGELEAGWFRRDIGFEILRLDEGEYADGKAPRDFDVVDTGSLADDKGVLNALVTGLVLLKKLPSATIYTDCYAKNYEAILEGHTKSFSLLLGLTPAEYWTNSTSVAVIDEVLATFSERYAGEDGSRNVQSRLAWKWNSLQVPGQKDQLQVGAQDLILFFEGVFKRIFKAYEVSQDNSKRRGLHHHFHFSTASAILWVLCDRLGLGYQEVMDEYSGLPADLRAGCLHLDIRGWGSCGVPEPSGKIRALESLFEKDPPPFVKWTNTPDSVAITFTVPAEKWQLVAQCSRDEGIPLPLKVRIPEAEFEYTNYHLSFGMVTTVNSPDQDDFAVQVDEDKEGWSGSSNMVVSFYLPLTVVAGFIGSEMSVSLCTADAFYNKLAYKKVLGNPDCEIYKVSLDKVLISKLLPGQRSLQGGTVSVDSATTKMGESKITSSMSPMFTAQLDEKAEGNVFQVVGHIDVISDSGRSLLADKSVPIKMEQVSPFTIEVVCGARELVLPIVFSVPISKEKCALRVARKSQYVEVVASLVKPLDVAQLDTRILPSMLIQPSGIPATLNIPHLNLDNLPILSIDEDEDEDSRIKFLTTLTSLIFSGRERRLREEVTQQDDDYTGLGSSPRLNFKESLFTMFMLSSGLQGGQTGLFAISDPKNGGIHMLLFVNAIRVDGPHASVVLDAAILPFTQALVDSKELEGFLLLIRTLECCTITVDDEELKMWKKALPAFVERCRTWEHNPKTCEYVARAGEKEHKTIPLSLKEGEQVICSCGQGRLPQDFIPLPEWDESAAKYSTRVAISPVYASQLVEDIIDPELARGLAGGNEKRPETCRACGKVEDPEEGVALKKCMRCLKAKYCSAECQKRDWRKHRMECEEVEEHHRK
ncbi:hypothetical protein QBC40DRAFT_262527 [Triangularia verruculosa]|uniref:MYND-type domain-containing protein n=1 Tax=Triangularia verruculosa TaxID=2587418 RepID=A0AAN6XMH2_9PEZI|nr:hypothetical protein QBC40DRAFT_262527 [Triangularia verruculosa]